jgi:hypothetical protein
MILPVFLVVGPRPHVSLLKETVSGNRDHGALTIPYSPKTSLPKIMAMMMFVTNLPS